MFFLKPNRQTKDTLEKEIINMIGKIEETTEGEVLLQQWNDIRKGTKHDYITFYKEVSQAVNEATASTSE